MTAPIALQLEHSGCTSTAVSPRVLEIAAMFGLGVDRDRRIDIVPRLTVRLGGGAVVLITGASGGGKTTLLRLMRAALADRPDATVIDFDTLDTLDAADRDDAGDRALVDAFEGALADAVRWLSLAGLNDAFVMLRTRRQLSDGQRYRFKLARAMAAAEAAGGGDGRLTVVLADEFGATLDRLTAAVIARNVRQWTGRADHVAFVAASSHDDLLEPLDPDTLIVQHPGGRAEVFARDDRSKAN